ncbi:MAG: sugar-binding domain-containing protein [bacterium]
MEINPQGKSPIEDIRSHLDGRWPPKFRTDADYAHYDLPDDTYKPAMKTGEEHLKPGSRVLKNGWMMCQSDKMPDPADPSWKEVKMPSQWAVADPKLFTNTGNVWYMKRFLVKPGEAGPEKHLELTFKGVDYQAEVFLNGDKLGEHEGYFSPFSVDLDGKVQEGQMQTLMVKASAPEDPGKGLLKEQIKGILNHHDCRPGTSGGFGAPKPLGNTGGIWNDVILESTGKESIENQYVDCKLSEDHKKADLSFNYLMVNHGAEKKTVTVETRYAPMGEKDPEKFKVVQKTLELKPGFNQVSLGAVEENPRLWWSHDLGEPNLYQMETSILDGEKPSDTAKGHFGIRKVEWDEKTGRLKLNDKSVYQKGTNYIATQWLSTYNEQKYEKDLHQMKEANMNAVRVHAHVLPQEFYDAADKEGMLVWADFPLHWGTSPSLSFMSKARGQYREFIETYRNHPSVWLWCAHNEPVPYDFPLDFMLDRDAAKLDPTRAHKRESSFWGEHFYPGWYDFPYGKSYTDITKFKPVLPSEFGAQAIPASMKDIIPEEKQWPISNNEELWSFHDFQTVNNYKHVGRPEAFKDIDDYIETTQKYQYDYNKYVTEYFRRTKYQPTAGLYGFMFKECWPSVTWGIVDYKNRPKMAFEAMKNSLSPTLASIEWHKTNFKPGETVKAPIWLVNDLPALKDSNLKWKVYEAGDEKKKPILSGELSPEVPADSSTMAQTVEFKIPKGARKGQKWILDVSWNDAGGKKLSHNAYQFGVPSPTSGPFRYEPVNPEYPPAG